MNSNTKIYLLSLITIIGSFILYYVEQDKENKLVPVKCRILDYDCFGKAANTTFIYKNKKYSIGGAPNELCNEKTNNKEYATLYYFVKDDSFYLKNSTNSKVYLYFILLGIFLSIIPYIRKKADDSILKREFKKR
ncbi:hypothetical protein B0I03_103347 [Flavobacterium aquaticum]|uniref:DUF3592 domain-containing protein n=1 Tax=Flavobacterium aquaticum TaxID=1236486 RepID=A0A327Z0W9_9FLAO|nr:hypothetical protein [Flavobacterium aquaticum]RAK23879.1 hypothetical protein B0I03_103347 [Flavobacterium aquaticum]